MSRPSPSPSPSLTERRKAATRMEIARAAAGLFVRQGLRATRAEDIAQAAGIAPRTFYRYFATKEEAVAPLYSVGADRWTRAVHEAPAGLSVPEALEHAARHTLTPGGGVSAASWEWARTLVRLATSSPALRKVWAEVCHETEGRLAEVLRARDTGSAPAEGNAGDDSARAHSVGPDSVGPDSVGPDSVGPDNVADPAPAPSPGLHFAAAVAAASIRVAVETWAAGDAPAQGPEGPAALAMRNLGALRDFPWEEVEA